MIHVANVALHGQDINAELAVTATAAIPLSADHGFGAAVVAARSWLPT